MTTIELHLSQELEETAHQIIHEAGLTPTEVVQRLMQYIARQKSLPIEILRTSDELKTEAEKEHAALMQRREAAIAAIKKHRKGAVIGPLISIEEIISARDEGRKYL